MLRHTSGFRFVERRGAILVLAASVLMLMFAFVALSVDVGYMTITKAELQNAADAASMAGVRELSNGHVAARAAAKDIALLNQAAGGAVVLPDADIDIGFYDFAAKTFTSSPTNANAVKVTTRIANRALFFAPVLQNYDFDMAAEAIAMLNPRDIVFVVDLSGSMNDDTEPCWATPTINAKFGPLGFTDVADPLIEDLYADLGFGVYPGTTEWLGAPLGIAEDNYAYAELTKDDGPLTLAAVPSQYRIDNADDEPTRKQKCYSWVIDTQIASQMPAAIPLPDSTVNYDYWAKYLDYVIGGAYVGIPPPPSGGGGGGGGGGGPIEPPPPSPPIGRLAPRFDLPGFDQLQPRRNRVLGALADLRASAAAELLLAPTALTSGAYPGCPRRGDYEWMWLPYWQDGDYIGGFNNPNYYTFPSTSETVWAWQNRIGYITYVQFMHDWGRDRSPEVDNWSGNDDPALAGKTPLSTLHPDCPRHNESTAGGVFSFPPRVQPLHAVRRAMIAAIQAVKTQNAGITSGFGDNIAIVSYDGLDSYHTPQVIVPLTSDYDAAMLACTNLDAVSDIGATTASEAGLLTARAHLKSPANGGAGRPFASKVVVLLTDGVPNAWQSTTGDINGYIAGNASGEYYAAPYTWYNSCLVQAAQMTGKRIVLYPVGMGLGTDYDFMDRMARLAGTAEGGQSVRGSGNPAVYEDRLIEIFDKIVTNPGGRLVE